MGRLLTRSAPPTLPRGSVMPRPHKKPVNVIAVSPAMLAAMFSIRPTDIKRAVDAGELKTHGFGNRSRIIIKEAMTWLRKRPPYKNKFKKEAQHADA